MNNLDQKIQAALGRDSSAQSISDQPNLAEEILLVFRTRQRWLATLFVIFNVVAFAVLVYAVIRFYGSDVLASQVRWGVLALALLLVVSMLKIWFWLEMQTNRVVREVKRLELLLVSREKK